MKVVIDECYWSDNDQARIKEFSSGGGLDFMDPSHKYVPDNGLKSRIDSSTNFSSYVARDD